MSAETKDFLSNPLPLVAVALLAAGVLVRTLPLESARPHDAAAHSANAIGEQDVRARLWQDPFEVVPRPARRETPSQRATRTTDDPLHAPGSLTRQLEQATRDPGAKVTVLGVMVFGSPYAEDVETRRRMRYAVLSGLAARHDVPDNPGALGYIWTDAAATGGARATWCLTSGLPPRRPGARQRRLRARRSRERRAWARRSRARRSSSSSGSTRTPSVRTLCAGSRPGCSTSAAARAKRPVCAPSGYAFSAPRGPGRSSRSSKPHASRRPARTRSGSSSSPPSPPCRSASSRTCRRRGARSSRSCGRSAATTTSPRRSSRSSRSAGSMRRRGRGRPSATTGSCSCPSGTPTTAARCRWRSATRSPRAAATTRRCGGSATCAVSTARSRVQRTRARGSATRAPARRSTPRSSPAKAACRATARRAAASSTTCAASASGSASSTTRRRARAARGCARSASSAATYTTSCSCCRRCGRCSPTRSSSPPTWTRGSRIPTRTPGRAISSSRRTTGSRCTPGCSATCRRSGTATRPRRSSAR